MAVNSKSQTSIDQFNAQLRSDPTYRAFLQSIGANPNGPLRLSDHQRKQAEAFVRRTYGDIGKLQVDPAGNLNQDEGWSKHKKWAIPAAIGAATLGLGAAGVGPAASAGAGGVIPSSSIPTSLAMQAVPSMASTVGGGVTGAMSGSMPVFAGGGITGALKHLIPNSPDDWRTVAQLAPLAAMPFMNGGNPFSSDEEAALLDEVRRGMAIQRQRLEQTQPVFDDLVRRTHAAAPNASYGGPAYQYQGPRFGG